MDPGTVLGGRRVDVGPLQLGVVDADGVAWRIAADGLQGWDSAEVRTQITQREAAHGAWMGPTYLGERVITLGGTIAAPTSTLADAAVEQLLAAVPMDDFATLTVYESIAKQAAVRHSGKPLIKWETDRVVTWSLLVTAPDPRRYGTSLRTASTGLPTTSGGLTLPDTPPLTMSAVTEQGFISAGNEGSIASLPVLTVLGPVQTPTITVLYPDGTTQALNYGRDIGNGGRLVLDCAARTATLGGASRRRYLSGTWPTIPAGGSVQILFGSPTYSATATLTAAWRPAWR